MPLHVPDAPDGLDLGVLGAELRAVFVFPLFKQVLVTSVAWVLVPHPPATGRAAASEPGERPAGPARHPQPIAALHAGS